MVLSGEGADEVFGGYLYFHKAPNKVHGCALGDSSLLIVLVYGVVRTAANCILQQWTPLPILCS